MRRRICSARHCPLPKDIRCRNQSLAGALTGHVSAQAPHSMHSSALISYLPSFSEIASTGHSAAQAPQAMHSSEILYAMIVYLQHVLWLLYHTMPKKSNTFPVKFSVILRYFYAKQRKCTLLTVFSPIYRPRDPHIAKIAPAKKTKKANRTVVNTANRKAKKNATAPLIFQRCGCIRMFRLRQCLKGSDNLLQLGVCASLVRIVHGFVLEGAPRIHGAVDLAHITDIQD